LLPWATIAKIYGMRLQINGEDKMVEAPLTLTSLIASMGLKSDRVAVELNRDIVPRTQWPETNLAEGDRLEIVHFVGGGSADRPIY
jgi:thiamine biosynthesis protein ThiS